jgi:cytochrome c oxidase assembly protein subunit 15
MTGSRYNRWLHGYAIFVACATFLLIVAGALVTGNDAGLSVPDWPTSFGSFRMPRMVGGVKYEHGHRMIAGAVGILTVILALWIWRREPRRWVRRLGGAAVLGIVAQAMLGGITVLLYLPVTISVSHACLAQLFFCIAVSLALFTGRDWRWDDTEYEDTSNPPLRRLSLATTVLVFIQLLLGAAFRHHGFGIVPHILVAGLVTIGVLWLLARILSEFGSRRQLKRAASLLSGLLVLQVFLGIGSYLMLLSARNAPQPLPSVVAVTTTHVAVGALVLASSLLLTLKIYRYVGDPGRALAAPAMPVAGEATP